MISKQNGTITIFSRALSVATPIDFRRVRAAKLGGIIFLQTMAQERIYIGGLNPPRLSGRDILRRLKSIDTVEINSSSIAKEDDDASENDYFESGGKPYLHITATSKDESISALSIIQKQYHNVKWKGCKLVVELAKPHFLDRLQQERIDREKRKAEEAAMKTIPKELETSTTLEEFSRIPRRLRVRKKHGDTAVHIDTKPWTVETWSRFHKARTKLKQREEKHNANLMAKSSRDEHFSPSGPLMHRAVHIRFATEDSSSTIANHDRYPSEKDDDVGGVISSDDSSSSSSSLSDSDSDSESSNESAAGKGAQPSKNQTPEKYEWSSDDDSDSDDSETPKATVNFDSKDNPDEGEAKKEIYHWSTDDDSSSDEDGDHTKFSFPSREKQQLKLVSANQEFAAGFGDTPFDEDEGKDSGDDENSYDYERGATENFESDLVGDVSSNLNILSSIFPDMAKTKPMNPDSEDKSTNDDEGTSAMSGTKKHNSNLGFMPRFDPSAKSSEQYIVEDEQPEEEPDLPSEDKSDEDEMSEEESDSDDEKEEENDTKKKLPNVSTVYEQDKLENVFKSARDAWTADQNPATASGNAENDSKPSEKTSSFSFGFNLDDNKSEDAKKQETNESSSANNAFSFGFNLPEPETQEKSTVPAGNDDATTEHKDSTDTQTGALASSTNDSDDESQAEDDVPRHRGLTLPDEDLRKYVDNFFGCNDGARIMQNPQDFMNDEKERAEWNSERQTLTLDWKRKRKYAVTRIQKRMKVRRR